jgi:hypothetical protein
VSRRKLKVEPAKLAKVIPLQGWRSEFVNHEDAETEDVARRDYFHAKGLADITKAGGPKEEIEIFRACVQRALKSVVTMKALLEDQLGGRFPVCSQNAKALAYLTERLFDLTKWDTWCIKEMQRFAPDAQIYNLAEFRRFRNRVVNKGATP